MSIVGRTGLAVEWKYVTHNPIFIPQLCKSGNLRYEVHRPRKGRNGVKDGAGDAGKRWGRRSAGSLISLRVQRVVPLLYGLQTPPAD